MIPKAAFAGVIPEKFFNQAQEILARHKAEYKGVYYMKGGFLGKVLNNPITTLALDAAAAISGNPELIPLINAGTSTAGHLVKGDSLGKSLGQGALSGGLAFAGQEIAPVIGNAFSGAFPETAASLGVTGGSNSLTDLFGQTTGGGSWAGVGTIGGDLAGNFAPGSGLESLFGASTPNFGSSLNTTSALTSPTSPGYGGTSTTDPATDLARATSAASATSPASAPTSFGTGTTAPTIGGGSSGGFFSSAPEGSENLSDLFTRGITSPTDTGENFFSAPSYTPPDFSNIGNGYSASELGTNALKDGLPSSVYSPVEGFKLSLDGGSKMPNSLASLFNPTSGLVNNLLRTAITGATTKTNQPGYDLEANAAKEAAANYQPFLDTGTQAAHTLADLFGTSGQPAQATAQQNFRNTPGYDFVRSQGIKALDASAARKGGLVGGNQYKALEDYGSGLADTTYQQYVNNLRNQADQGISAAGGVGTGNIAAAGATAEGRAAANAKRNQITGGLADALFPANDLLSLIANGGNGGLLSLFR